MSKNIIICCDGTSNDVTCDSTNVLRLYRSLQRDGSQIAYYDSGVGTLADPTKLTAIGKRFESGNRFKKSFSISQPARIHFIGAWDTVSSFGWIWNLKTVPYSANNPSVDHIRHAVSIDEHRACFQPNLFRPKSKDQHETFKQLWFAGAHADVGGGYPEKDNGLAKIALEWMYDEAEQQGCLFGQSEKEVFLGISKKGKSKPDAQATAHNSTEGFWHVLEGLPRKQWDHDAEPERLRWFLPNLYRRRKMPEGAVLHESVGKKLDEDSTYRPRNLPNSYSLDR